MTRHRIKKGPGFLRAGFHYQDLVAIETLIDFYGNRNLYEWVQLEAEESEFRSIEDVVACRPDGRYELTQVKFTADPHASANRLSWTWLTKIDGKNRRSLLQKWAATTLQHKVAGTLACAALKTDRIPDAEFGECLKGKKVDYSVVSEEVKAKLEDQLGSHEDAESFFDSFEFVHSKPRMDDFEEELWNRIAFDTDRGGWCQFLDYVRQWARNQDQPHPDGKIKYINLRQVFSIERPKPISQDFRVPRTYCVPDEEFDRAFLEEITGSDGLTVLWGPPGRGKSTYLSRCVAHMKQKNAVCIRHHYSLSLEARSGDRFRYYAIAQSLKHQLEEAMPDLNRSRRDFGEFLEEAALRLQGKGRRLIVIVDGLDHVWREHRDHEEMEALFTALLPLPPNVRLVVGTQKIASEHLPARLLNTLPTERWTELPLMSQAAVQRWLHFQDKAGRLNLKVVGWQSRDHVFRAVAQAFHDISSGLPLHLIYSFEAITRTGSAVTADDMAALPACPTGDIRDYYRSFWKRMGEKAQTILHVLAGLEFGPPPSAIQDCFGRSDESLTAFASINHLLDYQETEVRPFHGSLFAFVRDLPEHRETFHTHAVDVLSWLESRAPDYWRWAWLWITKAQLGDSSDLLTGPSREWAINALVAGYPIEQVTSILDHAEKVAFDAFDLPRFLSLRSLKERTIDGPVSQTDEWPLFREVGVSLSSDPSVGAVLRAELHEAPDGILPYIVSSTDGSIREQLAEDAMDELNRRITLYDRNTGSYNRPSELANAIVAVFAYFAPENAQDVVAYAQKIYDAKEFSTIYAQAPSLDSNFDRAIAFAKAKEDADALITTYTRESILVFNFDNVFEAGQCWTGFQLDRDVLATLCLEGLAPSQRPKLKALTHPAIRCLALLKGGAAERARAQRDISRLFVGGDGPDERFDQDTRFVLYENFFAALTSALSGGKAQGWSKIPMDARTTWLSEAVRTLEQLAGEIAERWQTSQQWPTLQEIYGTFEHYLPVSRSFTAQRRFTAVLVALRDVAIDLCTIARALDSNAYIDVDAIEFASKSPFWSNGLWLEAFTERRLPLHTREAAQVFVERAGNYLDKTITNSNERATTAVRLAMFASDCGLTLLAQKELRRAAGCLLGYGHHKDMFAFEVLESLDLLARKGDEDARKTLLDLAGEFEAITIYTDGDHTRHTRADYYEAIAFHFPKLVPVCYAHLIRNEEWYYAEGLATAVVATDQVESRTGLALLESYIDPGEVLALENSNSTSLPYIGAALAVVHRKTGRSISRTLDHEASRDTGYLDSKENDSSPEIAAASVPDPSEFPPGQLQGYVCETLDSGTYRDRQELITGWLRFWEAAGRAEEALNDLKAATSETTPHRDLDTAFDRAFDVAFKIALEVQGRSKAYPWLIHGHIARFGWLRRQTSAEEAQDRIRAVVEHFRVQWRKFIRDTSKPVFPTGAARNGIDIGLSRLVYFLIEVGELDLARDYALEMALIFKEELKEQPIEAPEWSR